MTTSSFCIHLKKREECDNPVCNPSLRKADYTLGPWLLSNSGYANAPSVIYVGDKMPNYRNRYPLSGVDWIAEVKQDESPRHREYEANARVLSAAPELYEALKALADWCDNNINGVPFEYGKIMEAVDSAIFKADGRGR